MSIASEVETLTTHRELWARVANTPGIRLSARESAAQKVASIDARLAQLRFQGAHAKPAKGVRRG